jgi:hypothetical protein
MFTLERIADELRTVVAGLDPGTVDGRDAARLTRVAADCDWPGAVNGAPCAPRRNA